METYTHIGDSIEFQSDIDSSVSLSFLPLDFFDHWERGSTLANFIADYYRHNFPNANAHNLISTVLNELIENSVKFSRNNSSKVALVVRKRDSKLLMKMENDIPFHRKEKLVDTCEDLFNRDLDELYIERIQQNADNSNQSGIGLILIKKDYSTALSFELYEESRNATVRETDSTDGVATIAPAPESKRIMASAAPATGSTDRRVARVAVTVELDLEDPGSDK